jgi:hypothetical protein
VAPALRTGALLHRAVSLRDLIADWESDAQRSTCYPLPEAPRGYRRGYRIFNIDCSSKAAVHSGRRISLKILVGATGFEPATPCAQGRCATGLRYAPTLQPSYHSPS